MGRGFGNFYYPCLAVNPAEMRALEELPEFTKDALFPIIKFSPWANSSEYASSVDRLVRAYGDRPVIADIDDSYASNRDAAAVRFHSELVNSDEREQVWRDFVRSHENLIPCARLSNGRLEQHLEHFEECLGMGRGLVLRVEINSSNNSLDSSNAEDVLSVLRQHTDSFEDIAVFVDCGHILTLDEHLDEITGLVRSFMEFDEINIILCSGSFPQGFTTFSGVALHAISSRQVFAAVSRATNYTKLYYSDLSATRLGASKSGGGGRVPNRIDLPRTTDWVFARNKDEEWTFQEAAQAMIASEYWPDPAPNIYGIHRIYSTAEDGSARITTLGVNAAVRINIHLFEQAHFDTVSGELDTDEDWSD